MSTSPFSTKQLCKLLDITYRQADHWTRKGYLRPRNYQDLTFTREINFTGSGTHRGYSAEDAVVAMALKELSALGCSAPMDTVSEVLYFALDGRCDYGYLVLYMSEDGQSLKAEVIERLDQLKRLSVVVPIAVAGVNVTANG